MYRSVFRPGLFQGQVAVVTGGGSGYGYGYGSNNYERPAAPAVGGGQAACGTPGNCYANGT